MPISGITFRPIVESQLLPEAHIYHVILFPGSSCLFVDVCLNKIIRYDLKHPKSTSVIIFPILQLGARVSTDSAA
jgi:hypothetical protein